MASTKCLGCQEEIVGGQFVTIPAGAIHPECFICPCCGKSLLNAKGYLPYKGNFVCSVGCRTLAVRDPSLLLQTARHWREVQTADGRKEWQPAK